jgi:hypothetical protein
MCFNGSASAGLTINLTGHVASDDVFVLAHNGAGAAILAQADQTDGAGWFTGDDAVALRRGSTILDVVGQIGFDPGTDWGSGLSSTADNTLRRDPSICGGDTLPSDGFDPAMGWIGLAADTVDGLGSQATNCAGADAAPAVASTFPANGATDFPAGASLIVTFSEPVNVSSASFLLICVPSGDQAFVVSGGPSIYTIDPATDPVPGESCTLTVIAANVTDRDANADRGPDNLAWGRQGAVA